MKQWNFYKATQLRPQGWLLRQLKLQAEGLCGSLDLIWPDVRDSAWIGGAAEGWERVPYWLDGFIPMAYLLRDGALIQKAQCYIDAILAAQKPDGWICPCADDLRAKYDTWATILISKVLTVYYECSGDARVPTAIYRAMKNYHELLKSGSIQLFDWGKFRWFEAFIALNFLYEHYREDWIRELAALLRDQGADYEQYCELWKKPSDTWRFDTHIVNIAMMFKYEAVSHELLGEEYCDRAEALYRLLHRYHGTPVELLTGDEVLAGLSPIHGSELCSVVELMYSYEQLFAYTGERKWAERLEVIAFNALPATVSEDQWTHQYDQLSNQTSCTKIKGEKIFTTNNEEAHLFGLEPNFGCCTANFGQGWPKLALSAFLHRGDHILNALPIPCSLHTEDLSITLQTEYPFRNSFCYRISSQKPFSLTIRIPSFAENVALNKSPKPSKDITLQIPAGDSEWQLSYTVSPYFADRPHELSAVKYGSLVFSVPISYRKRMLEYVRDGVERKFPYCDYELIPTSDWNYAYCSEELTVEERTVNEIPFSQEHPPLVIRTSGVPIAWGNEGSHPDICAKVPKARIPCGSPQELLLYPYGCCRLRMTELPNIKIQ